MSSSADPHGERRRLSRQSWAWAVATFLATMLGAIGMLLALPGGFSVTLIVLALLAGLLAAAVGQLRRHQLQLQASRASLQAVFDRLPHAVAVIDSEDRIRFVNQRLADLTGKRADALVGGRPDCLPGGADLWRDDPLSEAPVAAVCRDAEGEDHHLQLTRAAFVDAETGRPETLILGVDVTAYHESQARHRRIAQALDQAGEAIAVHDLSGRIEVANTAFANTMGFEGEDVSGQLIDAMAVEGSDDLELVREIRATLARGEAWKRRYASRWPDGDRYRDATVTPFRDEQGNITGYIGVLRDVTREVELEHALRQSQKLEAVGRLAGGIAHDFNNLLTVILGFAETLKADLPPDDTATLDIAEIEKAALRGAELTRKLLNFSRQRSSREASAALNRVITELLPMIHQLLGESFQVTLELDDDLGHVQVSSSDIEQILINLCVNARDAMGNMGELRIRTRIEAVEAGQILAQPPLSPGRYAVLAVSDSGHGMTAEVRERALEPFFTTKDMGAGTGLGLTTVYGTAEQHGGAVRIDSQPGEGTTVRVWLPLASTPEEEAAPETAEADSDDGTGKRILLAEDEAPIRKLVTTALERAGYLVTSAADGVEALERARELDDIALLLTDIVMPRMGGLELRDALLEIHPDTPVLFMSGYAPDDPRTGSLGEDHTLLTKPFRPARLLEEIATLLHP